MTRADTAERILILPHKANSTPTTCYTSIFYATGSMLVILSISNITVDDLYYGIFITSHFLSTFVSVTVGRTVLVEYYRISLVLVLSIVLSKSTPTEYTCF